MYPKWQLLTGVLHLFVTIASASSAASTPCSISPAKSSPTGVPCGEQGIGYENWQDNAFNLIQAGDCDAAITQCRDACLRDSQCKSFANDAKYCYLFTQDTQQMQFQPSNGTDTGIWYGRECFAYKECPVPRGQQLVRNSGFEGMPLPCGGRNVKSQAPWYGYNERCGSCGPRFGSRILRNRKGMAEITPYGRQCLFIGSEKDGQVFYAQELEGWIKGATYSVSISHRHAKGPGVTVYISREQYAYSGAITLFSDLGSASNWTTDTTTFRMPYKEGYILIAQYGGNSWFDRITVTDMG